MANTSHLHQVTLNGCSLWSSLHLFANCCWPLHSMDWSKCPACLAPLHTCIDQRPRDSRTGHLLWKRSDSCHLKQSHLQFLELRWIFKFLGSFPRDLSRSLDQRASSVHFSSFYFIWNLFVQRGQAVVRTSAWFCFYCCQFKATLVLSMFVIIMTN